MSMTAPSRVDVDGAGGAGSAPQGNEVLKMQRDLLSRATTFFASDSENVLPE